VAALTASASTHQVLQERSTHRQPQLARRREENRGRRKSTTAEEDELFGGGKKIQPKKTALSNRLIYGTFRTAMTTQCQ
jgi:hypothetical protein